MEVQIDSKGISLEDIISVARRRAKVSLSEDVKDRVKLARDRVDAVVKNHEVVYGITTGFGAFKDKTINDEETILLQENLILSHAVGVGDSLDTEFVRGIMLLMVNYLSKGFSGIKIETLQTLVEMLNRGVHPLIPEKGSVGSSGDLAPSAHMALVLIGKGEAEYQGKIYKGDVAMMKAGIKPITLAAKEGLALINNTSTMTSISSMTLFDAKRLIKLADVASALSVQALRGTDAAYDARIHAIKPHSGQVNTAQRLRDLLEGSEFIDRKRVQEAYSFRCIPQIHGAIRLAIDYVESVINTEINSVTDNPLIFVDGNTADVISGGNFHGEPVAIAMDSLAIALCEIGNVSDRRVAALVDSSTSNGLPSFLIEQGGLNSGFMILQYVTAALVSENKVLAHPASVDSIPTSANIEDLVSMGTISARKANEILGNVLDVLTIEVMTACQAIDLRNKVEGTSLELSERTRYYYDVVREIVPYFEKDELYYPYMRDLKDRLLDLDLPEIYIN